MKLIVLSQRFSVCRLEKTDSIPLWATTQEFFSITKTADELSIVCPEASVPANIKAEHGWRGLKIEGPLDFSQIGVLNSLAEPLAKNGISIFAISTYDTDYVFLKEADLDRAKEALRHSFEITS